MVGRDETLQQLKGHLEETLLQSAKVRLREVGISPPIDITLEQALRLLASQQFEDAFKYDYSDKPDEIKPLQSLGGVRPLAALCGITDPTSTQVRDYINTVIIGSVNMPDEIKSQAENDLYKISEEMVAKTPSTQWYLDNYTKSFDVAPRDERTIKADGVYVYANAALTGTTKICVIYHMSVYYEVATEFKILREQLKNDVYTSAETLTKKETINSTAKLRDALREYTCSKFADQFGFNYTESPPKFEGGTASTLVRNDALKYIQDDLNTTHDFIETDFFSAVNVENEAIKNLAKNDISSWFERIVQNLSEGEWTTIPVNQSYPDPKGRALNKVTANIIVTLFLDKRKTTKGELLSVMYMYILGMFFEEVPTKLLLTNSLYKELCKNLRPDIKIYIPPSNPKGDQWELNSMLFQFAKQEFQKSFGFEWARKNTKPNDPEVLQFRIPYSVLLDLEVNGADSPTKEDIEARVSLAAFRKDGYEFPWGLKPPQQTLQAWVFDELVERIQAWNTEITMISNIIGGDAANLWRTESIHSERPIDPSKLDMWLKQYSTFVFTVGKKAAGNDKINRYIVYYLSVFCGLHVSLPEGP